MYGNLSENYSCFLQRKQKLFEINFLLGFASGHNNTDFNIV